MKCSNRHCERKVKETFFPEQIRDRFARGGAVCVNPSVGWSIVEIRPLSNLNLAAKSKLRKFCRNVFRKGMSEKGLGVQKGTLNVSEKVKK